MGRFMDCELVGSSIARPMIESARQRFSAGDMDGVLKNLVKAVVADKEFCDDLPRKTTISIFNLLGQDHELTRVYRRQFDMAVY